MAPILAQPEDAEKRITGEPKHRKTTEEPRHREYKTLRELEKDFKATPCVRLDKCSVENDCLNDAFKNLKHTFTDGKGIPQIETRLNPKGACCLMFDVGLALIAASVLVFMIAELGGVAVPTLTLIVPALAITGIIDVIGTSEYVRRKNLLRLSHLQRESRDIEDTLKENLELNDQLYAAHSELPTMQDLERARTRAMWERENVQTLNVMTSLKASLHDATKQIKSGFRHTAWMYATAFCTGIGLIIASVGYAIYHPGDSLIAGVFGVSGVSVMLTFLIANPPRDLERSRARLAQLQAEFYNWFLDVYNWNTYLGDMWTRILDGAREEDVKKIQDVVEIASDRCVAGTTMMLKNTAKYCIAEDTRSGTRSGTRSEEPTTADKTD